MPLVKEDLTAIDQIVSRNLQPVKKDLAEVKKDLIELKKDVTEMKKEVTEMKVDLRLLATLNQLDEIKKDKRLRGLYTPQTGVK